MFTDLRLLLLLAARPESLLYKKAKLVVVAAAKGVGSEDDRYESVGDGGGGKRGHNTQNPNTTKNYKSKAVTADTTQTYLSDNIVSGGMSREVLPLFCLSGKASVKPFDITADIE